MHPSFTLLLRYRSQVCIWPCDGYTSPFKLQSQATLLRDTASHIRSGPSALPSLIRDSRPVSCSIPGFFLALGSRPNTASRSKAHSVCWNPTKADRDDVAPSRPQVAPVAVGRLFVRLLWYGTRPPPAAHRASRTAQQQRYNSHQTDRDISRVRNPNSGRDSPLLVHSPLLQQSMLLAVPPLSDMLKFGGSIHVRQVTVQIFAWHG